MQVLETQGAVYSITLLEGKVMIVLLTGRLQSPLRTPLLRLPALSLLRLLKLRRRWKLPHPLHHPPHLPRLWTSPWRVPKTHPRPFPAKKRGIPSNYSSRTWYQTKGSTFTHSLHRYTDKSYLAYSPEAAFGEGCFPIHLAFPTYCKQKVNL